MNVCFLYSEVRSSEKRLGFKPGKMRYEEDTALIPTLAKQHDLRTVGELYDFLCERWLFHYADCL